MCYIVWVAVLERYFFNGPPAIDTSHANAQGVAKGPSVNKVTYDILGRFMYHMRTWIPSWKLDIHAYLQALDRILLLGCAWIAKQTDLIDRWRKLLGMET